MTADYMFEPTLAELREDNWRAIYQAVPSITAGSALAIKSARKLDNDDIFESIIKKPIATAIFVGGLALLEFGLAKLGQASQLWSEIKYLKG